MHFKLIIPVFFVLQFIFFLVILLVSLLLQVHQNFVCSSLHLSSSFIWFLLVHLCIVGDILQLEGYFFLYFNYIFSLVPLLLLSYWSFIKFCLLLLVVLFFKLFFVFIGASMHFRMTICDVLQLKIRSCSWLLVLCCSSRFICVLLLVVLHINFFWSAKFGK